MIDDGTRAPGHYGAAYGDPGVQHLGNDGGPTTSVAGGPAGNTGPGWHDEHHYRQFRDAHARSLDDEYAAWRRERFTQDFGRWRDERQETVAPEHESPLRSFGRAISETVTGSRDPSPGALDSTARDTSSDRPFDGGTEREADQRVKSQAFFERS
jgi:hypothetical protein